MDKSEYQIAQQKFCPAGTTFEQWQKLFRSLGYTLIENAPAEKPEQPNMLWMWFEAVAFDKNIPQRRNRAAVQVCWDKTIKAEVEDLANRKCVARFDLYLFVAKPRSVYKRLKRIVVDSIFAVKEFTKNMFPQTNRGM